MELPNSIHFCKTAYIIARQSFINSMVFRGNYFIGLASNVLFIYLSIELWKTLFHGRDEVNGINLEQLSTYLILARIITSIDMEFVEVLQQRVLSGEVVFELLRPMQYTTYLMSQEMGLYINRLFFQTLPIIAFFYFTIDLQIPKSILHLLFFLISIVLSFLVMFYINFITSIMTFWITQVTSLNILKTQTVLFLSGAFVPLWFFPSEVNQAIHYLPFSCVIFIPIQIYIHEYLISELLGNIFLQLFWIIVIAFTAHFIWNRALQRVSINGG
ncbi:ABC-2 family transporter protein [Paenibacillus sp. YYML68]|uniref:ABC transporter permease n=1 Tax=Paenibacillus sp. YYML68 TaxID=2909250 RepID=UPI0024931AB3|nr:ABC-2 family transporter protein [Paenibacillus sp. YYML68]